MTSRLLVVAVVAGCAHHAQPEPVSTSQASEAPEPYTPARDPVIGPAWVQATGAYVVEHCNRHSGSDHPSDGDPPSVHIVDAGGGVEVKQACGLVAFEIYSPQYRARFAHDVCGLSNETFDAECTKRFTDMFIARLSERYASANWSAVSQHCTAYPLECNSAVAIERQLLAAHNAGIQAWYAGAIAYAQARQEAAYEEERAYVARQAEERREQRRRFWEGLGNAAGSMAQALQPQPVAIPSSAPNPTVHCTTNTYGSTTYTDCN